MAGFSDISHQVHDVLTHLYGLSFFEAVADNVDNHVPAQHRELFRVT